MVSSAGSAWLRDCVISKRTRESRCRNKIAADLRVRVSAMRRLLLLLVTLVACATGVGATPKFSVVLVPDPQSYAVHPGYDIYNKQSRWIRDNQTSENIKFSIYLGDLTNNDTDDQWSVVSNALSILDTAGCPYSVLPGNHDYLGSGATLHSNIVDRILTKFNANVGPQRFSGKSWYGGNKDNTTNKNQNNYCFFSSGNLNFMVVSLELSPTKETITWANNLISQHPNHRVIIATHAYLNPGGGYNASGGNEWGVVGASGVDLFEECASRHSNVFMVVCGHVGESMVNTKTGVCGNTIYEMVVDYQFEKPLNDASKGGLGNGWMRLLTFDPDNNKIDARTFSVVSGDATFFTNGIDQFYEPDYNSSPTHKDHKFSLTYNMGTMGAYSYLNPSTSIHDFNANHSTGGNQLKPDIAQAANGDWAAVWQDDSDSNNIHRILLRGFDKDGNQRLAESVVNTTGVNTIDATVPKIAMCADGRFVVAYQVGANAIYMRTYNANGTANGTADQLVVYAGSGTARNPDVEIDDTGNFIVVWEDDSDGNGSYQIRARGFSFNYAQRFAAKTINSIAAGQQLNPAIAMAPNGDYVVAWDDDQESDGLCEIGIRGFLANETQRFTQAFANTTTTGQQRHPDVAMDPAGRFVAIWEDDADSNGSFQIRARGFSATGTQIIPEMDVNLLSTGNQLNPSVTMDSVGNWFAVWEDSRTGEGYQIVSQEFKITGARVFADDVQVNTIDAVDNDEGNPRRQDPVISVHNSGRYLVAWADDMDGDGSFEILAKGVTGTARSLVIKAVNGAAYPFPSDAFYKVNTNVTITAAPNPGYGFVRWMGDVPAGKELGNPLTITMDADKNLTALYQVITGATHWSLFE